MSQINCKFDPELGVVKTENFSSFYQIIIAERALFNKTENTLALKSQ